MHFAPLGSIRGCFIFGRAELVLEDFFQQGFAVVYTSLYGFIKTNEGLFNFAVISVWRNIDGRSQGNF